MLVVVGRPHDDDTVGGGWCCGWCGEDGVPVFLLLTEEGRTGCLDDEEDDNEDAVDVADVRLLFEGDDDEEEDFTTCSSWDSSSSCCCCCCCC